MTMKTQLNIINNNNIKIYQIYWYGYNTYMKYQNSNIGYTETSIFIIVEGMMSCHGTIGRNTQTSKIRR